MERALGTYALWISSTSICMLACASDWGQIYILHPISSTSICMLASDWGPIYILCPISDQHISGSFCDLLHGPCFPHPSSNLCCSFNRGVLQESLNNLWPQSRRKNLAWPPLERHNTWVEIQPVNQFRYCKVNIVQQFRARD